MCSCQHESLEEELFVRVSSLTGHFYLGVLLPVINEIHKEF